jgi:hypothetical protein
MKNVMLLTLLLSTSLVIAQVLESDIKVSTAPQVQAWSEVAYNSISDQYLVVWEDYRTEDSTKSDIYGQLVDGDGSLIGENFPVCTDTANQYWPHVAFDPVKERYLVVFSDYRNGTLDEWGYEDWQGNYDVYAALLDKKGNHIETANSGADKCFGIATHEAAIHYPSLAYNDLEETFLVVWSDYRHDNSAIYGQIVDTDGMLLSPPTVPDAAVNFAIATEMMNIAKDVPDVSFSPLINEWLVVFAQGDMHNSTIKVQRVNRQGVLLKRDGVEGMEPLLVVKDTHLGTDPAQPRLCFNSETGAALNKQAIATTRCECLVTWRQKVDNDIDLYCQRIAFYPDDVAVSLGLKEETSGDQTFYAVALTPDGVPGELPPLVYPISNAAQARAAAGLAFGAQDNEFMAIWGDWRQGRFQPADLYGQRLWIAEDDKMIWLGEDRSAPVDADKNFPIRITEHFEGGNLIGVAHNTKRNEFFVAYTFELADQSSPSDIYGCRITGSEPSAVRLAASSLPRQFELMPNYPNPFNPETTIRYRTAQAAFVEIAIYNPAGQRVRTLCRASRPAGSHSVVWDGRIDSGQTAVSGVYLCVLMVDGVAKAQKLTLLK